MGWVGIRGAAEGEGEDEEEVEVEVVMMAVWCKILQGYPSKCRPSSLYQNNPNPQPQQTLPHPPKPGEPPRYKTSRISTNCRPFPKFLARRVVGASKLAPTMQGFCAP